MKTAIGPGEPTSSGTTTEPTTELATEPTKAPTGELAEALPREATLEA